MAILYNCDSVFGLLCTETLRFGVVSLRYAKFYKLLQVVKIEF